MSEKPINDGGEAFPIASDVVGHCGGMSLRDYFAANAPSMDVADICDVMGWPNTLNIGGDGTEADQWNDTVWSRWRDLPFAERLKADVKFRYAWADAMLAARGESK